ncbi:hypothetical protein U9M48_036904 [Paspalum notatum var. saurae]|uniref:Uncharacterized protein n=1 Tax=Paspalum notatum var. saurae TaxID=547442 RepID=A0AAQ3UFD1_PASNO
MRTPSPPPWAERRPAVSVDLDRGSRSAPAEVDGVSAASLEGSRGRRARARAAAPRRALFGSRRGCARALFAGNRRNRVRLAARWELAGPRPRAAPPPLLLVEGTTGSAMGAAPDRRPTPRPRMGVVATTSSTSSTAALRCGGGRIDAPRFLHGLLVAPPDPPLPQVVPPRALRWPRRLFGPLLDVWLARPSLPLASAVRLSLARWRPRGVGGGAGDGEEVRSGGGQQEGELSGLARRRPSRAAGPDVVEAEPRGGGLGPASTACISNYGRRLLPPAMWMILKPRTRTTWMPSTRAGVSKPPCRVRRGGACPVWPVRGCNLHRF